MTELKVLIAAVQRHDIETVLAILDRDPAVVRGRDDVGATALHHAAFNGSRRIAQLLIERGAT
jgi:ankyrin repeat protein